MLINPKYSVEQFHLLFLNQLSQKLDKKLYCLKGGCNLRFFFHSIRYSEDIDLDVRIIAEETLRNKVNRLLNSQPFSLVLGARDISIHSISLPKQTATTQRWKIQLKLAGSTLPINTKIEFSRRETSGKALFEAINKELVQQHQLQPLYINHYNREAALQQKISALALRSQTQARDIFDCHLLLGQGVALTKPFAQTIRYAEQAMTNAANISFAEFKSQVVSYLLDDYQQQYDDEQLWEDMLSAITHFLSGLKS